MLNRITPALPPQAFQTYQVISPPDRTVVAACQQVGCEAWAHGWETAVDERTELGATQARYIRERSGRTYREQRTSAGLTVFRFASGQRCFAEHRTRPELYFRRGGDWRGNPTGAVRQHTRAAEWVEDFGEHQQRVADQHERG
ncbi:MAG TPA: hypothetical protein VJ957_12435 [Longimicrobiales bacterium]|nr:hypothetical protein [Longimicrobiales bacterium]